MTAYHATTKHGARLEDDDIVELLRTTRQRARLTGERFQIWRTADMVLMGHSFRGAMPDGLRGAAAFTPIGGLK